MDVVSSLLVVAAVPTMCKRNVEPRAEHLGARTTKAEVGAAKDNSRHSILEVPFMVQDKAEASQMRGLMKLQSSAGRSSVCLFRTICMEKMNGLYKHDLFAKRALRIV